MPGKPKLIILTGATATGKSGFIYERLNALPLSVINADSRQVYRDLTISSASPSAVDVQKFPHLLYNFLPVDSTFSAGEFARGAKQAITEVLGQGRVPLICGGTYFYLHALLNGLLPVVKISDSVRDEVEALTPAEAYQQLKGLDAGAAENNHPHNIVRVKRALMLCLETGGPISTLAKAGGIMDDYDILTLIFDMDRTALRGRIISRTKEMFVSGLGSEVEKVLENNLLADDPSAWRSKPALTAIGVREFFEAYESTGMKPAELPEPMLRETEERIVQNTIHLVKRQVTWFRNAAPKPPNTKTVDPSYENERIAALVQDFLSTPSL